MNESVKRVAYNNDFCVLVMEELLHEALSFYILNFNPLGNLIHQEFNMLQSGHPLDYLPQYSEQVLCQLVKFALDKLVIQPRDLLLVGLPRLT